MDGKPFNGMELLYGTADPDTEFTQEARKTWLMIKPALNSGKIGKVMVIGTTSDEPGDLQELWNKQDWNQKK